MTDVLAGQVLRFEWNNYTTSWGPAIRDLRRCGLFHDVTLLTSDNQLVTGIVLEEYSVGRPASISR